MIGDGALSVVTFVGDGAFVQVQVPADAEAVAALARRASPAGHAGQTATIADCVTCLFGGPAPRCAATCADVTDDRARAVFAPDLR